MKNDIPYKDNVLTYTEIFASIQGESSQSGLPCVFLRLYGCNVGCSFCDQPQSIKDKKRLSIANIVTRISSFNIPRLCITGGEPLNQWNGVYVIALEFIVKDWDVTIETSGCVPIEEDSFRRFSYVMDIKCPSSGVSDKNIYENLMVLREIDEVKFVISDRKDYDFMKKILQRYPTSAHILVSPCFNKDNKPVIGKELVEWLITDNFTRVRVQIQTHKILGVM